MGVVRCLNEVDSGDVLTPTDELGLLLVSEHPTIRVNDESGRADALPLLPSRNGDIGNHLNHHVSIEAWIQAVLTVLHVLNPRPRQRTVPEGYARVVPACERNLPRRKEVTKGNLILRRPAARITFQQNETTHQIRACGRN